MKGPSEPLGVLRLGEAVDDPPFPIMVYLVVPRRERKPLPAAEPLDVLVEPETLTSLVAVGKAGGGSYQFATTIARISRTSIMIATRRPRRSKRVILVGHQG